MMIIKTNTDNWWIVWPFSLSSTRLDKFENEKFFGFQIKRRRQQHQQKSGHIKPNQFSIFQLFNFRFLRSDFFVHRNRFFSENFLFTKEKSFSGKKFHSNESIILSKHSFDSNWKFLFNFSWHPFHSFARKSFLFFFFSFCFVNWIEEFNEQKKIQFRTSFNDGIIIIINRKKNYVIMAESFFERKNQTKRI